MNKTILTAALAGLMVVGAAGMAQANDDAMASTKEKCYGIAKAGKNDCAAANGAHACAGHATTDNDANDFAMVDAGKCAEMGGKTEAPAAE